MWPPLSPPFIRIWSWEFQNSRYFIPKITKNHEQLCRICQTVINLSRVIIISWKPKSIVFECKLKNIHKVLPCESILIRKKSLWRINFDLIKFLSTALLFEKLRNDCKNPLFLCKVMRIESDYADAVTKFTFVACNCRGLCYRDGATLGGAVKEGKMEIHNCE